MIAGSSPSLTIVAALKKSPGRGDRWQRRAAGPASAVIFLLSEDVVTAARKVMLTRSVRGR
jgi:hypothetical protein